MCFTRQYFSPDIHLTTRSQRSCSARTCDVARIPAPLFCCQTAVIVDMFVHCCWSCLLIDVYVCYYVLVLLIAWLVDVRLNLLIPLFMVRGQ